MSITPNDLLTFLKEIQTVYPNFKAKTGMAETWFRYLKDAPDLPTLMTALSKHMLNSPRFAPTVAEIRNHALSLGGGRFKAATGQYGALDPESSDRYDRFQDERGVSRVSHKDAQERNIKRYLPKSYLCKRNGKKQLKIEYCMDVLGANKVSEILRNELGISAADDLPKKIAAKDFSKRYLEVLADMMELADTFKDSNKWL